MPREKTKLPKLGKCTRNGPPAIILDINTGTHPVSYFVDDIWRVRWPKKNVFSHACVTTPYSLWCSPAPLSSPHSPPISWIQPLIKGRKGAYLQSPVAPWDGFPDGDYIYKARFKVPDDPTHYATVSIDIRYSADNRVNRVELNGNKLPTQCPDPPTPTGMDGYKHTVSFSESWQQGDPVSQNHLRKGPNAILFHVYNQEKWTGFLAKIRVTVWCSPKNW